MKRFVGIVRKFVDSIISNFVRNPMDDTIVKGVVFKGLGAASHTLQHQLPYFEKLVPAIKGFYPATLNVLLSRPVLFNKFDYETPVIQWHNNYHPEKFGFISAKLRIAGSPKTVVDAFIYVPANSPHTLCAMKMELILSSKLNNVSVGTIVEILFSQHCHDTEFAVLVN